MMVDTRDIRVVVVGDEKCGKTSLISRFISNRVPEVYKPTGFDKFFASKQLEPLVLGDDCRQSEVVANFTVWDTSGSTNYDSVRPLSYSEADIFIICFRISDPISLYNVKSHWIQEIRKHSNAPVVLCGCMSDLRSDPSTLAHLAKIGRSVVSVEQALSVSSQIGARSYVETRSQQSYEETLEAFRLAAGTALEFRDEFTCRRDERPGSAASEDSRRFVGDAGLENLNKSKSSFSGSYTSITGSLKNCEDGSCSTVDKNPPFTVSHTILEHDVFEHPLAGPRNPMARPHSPLSMSRPYSPAVSLPTSPLSLPTSPAKPCRTNPTSPQENLVNPVHSRSVSQPVVLRTNLDNFKSHWRGEEDQRLHLRGDEDQRLPPLLPHRAPSPPPRPSKSLQARSCSSSLLVNQSSVPPPEMRTQQQPSVPPQTQQHHHHLSRKNSFRSSLPVAGKPPLPLQPTPFPKSPTDLLSLASRPSPLTSESLLSSSPSSGPHLVSSRSRILNQLGVQPTTGEPAGKNYESLKSHTSTASHGSTGSKLSTASSSQISTGYNGPRDLDIPDTEDPELLKNLDFVSPKAGVYRPLNGPGGRNGGKKDKCSLM